ncbi:putative hydrolase, alpha/beta fold family [Salinisphaera sp. S4-8]|uniref:alpha/beta hydrolase n=1 Tax=Salinisphaera sp. S4-8 TaxID=633357 RepID=UPI0033426725
MVSQGRQNVSFESQGTTCAATLHLPEESDHQPLPTIVMVHGWGGTQLLLVTHFIEAFNAAGFAVLTFDYPGWGDSEGTPRHTINPWKREQVVEHAIAHARTLDQVDENRIVLWGTSFGGGHVVKIASRHPELCGAIAQVPMLDGIRAVTAVPFTRMLRFGWDMARDLARPGRTHYIPAIAPKGEYASMDRDGASRIDAWVASHLDEEYDNRVSAASLATMGFYRPFKYLKSIRIPTLIIGATRDTVAPFDRRKVESQASDQVSVKTIDANHFDPYLQPWYDTNIGLQLEFLRALVSTNDTATT